TVGFPQLALQVRELAGSNPMALQSKVPFGPIEDSTGNQYFFTVLDSRKESPPDSWTEIADTLTRDFRRLESYRVLERDATSYQRLAVADGLDSVAAALVPTPISDVADALKTSGDVHKGVTVSRQTSLPPEINTDPVKNAVVEAASKFDPTVDI